MLTDDQIRAIKLAKAISRKLGRDYPEISEDYRRGLTLSKIEEKYGLASEYGITNDVAETAVRFVLRDELTKRELRKLRKEHEEYGRAKTYRLGLGIHGLSSNQKAYFGKLGGMKGGKKNYVLGSGIFSMTPEDLSEAGRKGGKLGGRKGGKITGPVNGRRSYEQRLGIFSMSTGELSEAAVKGVEARGFLPWSQAEKDYCKELYQNPDFQYKSGRNRGRPDYRLIASGLKKKFGTKRTKVSLKYLHRKLQISG